jgi:WD40 repeat protein
MSRSSRISFVFGLLLLCLSGCANATPSSTPTLPPIIIPTHPPMPSPTPVLPTATPSLTATPLPTPTPSITPLPSPTPTITPTPLPFSVQPINVEASARVGYLGVFGRGAIQQQVLLAGDKVILVVTPRGLFFYDNPILTLRQSLPGARLLAISPDDEYVVVLTEAFEFDLVDAAANLSPRSLEPLIDPAALITGLPESDVLYQRDAYYCVREGIVTAVAFSADSRLFSAALTTGEIGVWQVADGKLQARLQRPATVRCEVATDQLAFSPDGAYLLTHEQAGHFVLWQLAEQKLVWYLRFQGQALSAVPFTPDGKYILTQSSSVSIREPRFGNVIFSAVGSAAPGSVSPDGKILVVFNRQVIQIIALGEYPAVLRTIATGVGVWAVSFTPDSKQVLVNDGEQVWQLSDFKQVSSGPTATATPLPISPEQVLRLGHLDTTAGFTLGSGRQISVWGTTTKGVYVQEVTSGAVQEASMSPMRPQANLDFNLAQGLFAACTSTGLEIASLASGTSQRISHCLDPQGGSLAISPDGSILARASSNVIDLLDPSTGQVMRQFYEHNLPIIRLVFSEDGATLAAYTKKYTSWGSSEFSLWQVSDGHSFGFRGLLIPGQVTAITVSPDGRYLAVCGDKLRLWQTENAEQVKIGEEGGHTALAFSPDGKLLASGDSQGEITLWSIPALEPLARIKAHSGIDLVSAYSPDGPNQGKVFAEAIGEEIQALAFTSDGANLISLGQDGLLKVWGLP